MARARSKTLAKVALALGVVALLVAAKAFGILDRLSEPARFAHSLVLAGAWGYLAFVAAFWLLQPFGVPGTVFVVAAPLIWAWPIAFTLSMVGAMGASVIGFALTRFVARDWLEPRIPARFKRYNDALERRAFLTVFVLRLVFWMPQVLHAFFGVSKVRGWTHFWGSLLGYLLPLFLLSFFGQKVFDAMRRAPSSVWVALVAVLLVGWAARAMYLRKKTA